MSDTNKNGQIDPDEAAGVVDEEETVNEALVEKKITDEEAGTVDTLDALEKEAQKIEMEEGMGASANVADIEASDIAAEAPTEKKAAPEEKPQAPSAPMPAEAVQEVIKEQVSEAKQENTREVDELTSEFKKPLS